MTFIPVFIFIFFLFSCGKPSGPTVPAPGTDSFMVTVHNGYGQGKYKSGDTVHIFSDPYSTDQLFDTWSGDTTLLQASREWHTWFIMPDRNVSFTGSIKNINPFTLHFEQIRGRDRLKPVYYYFPTNHKGIVYLFHGSDGSASTLVSGYEYQQLIKDLVSNGFGIIITEAEEATTGIDLNGDGKLRWTLLPMDTLANVDDANIRIISDTFYNRGLTDRSKPRYSIGMSDGGFFSIAISSLYHYKAQVSYCAQGSDAIFEVTTVPTQFCMARFDNNESVGSAGNADALTHSNTLLSRGLCSKYLINERSPLYPERFTRSGAISASQSGAIWEELKSKGYIDPKSYYIGYSDSLLSAYKNNRACFPIINSLTNSQQQFMLEQINLSVADHHIYSDYDRATIKFLNTQCN